MEGEQLAFDFGIDEIQRKEASYHYYYGVPDYKEIFKTEPEIVVPPPSFTKQCLRVLLWPFAVVATLLFMVFAGCCILALPFIELARSSFYTFL